jgi:hypothetical protein
VVTACAACRRPIEIRRTMLGTPVGVDPQPVEIVVGEGADVAVLTEAGIVARGQMAGEGVKAMRGYRLHRDTCRRQDEYRTAMAGYY